MDGIIGVTKYMWIMRWSTLLWWLCRARMHLLQ